MTSSDGSVLVTGGAGFMGSHVVDRLLADGYQVEAIDNLSGGSIANLDDARRSGGMRFHQIDVRAPEFVDLVGRLNPGGLIHLAGHVDRPGSLLDPLFDADVNVLGTLNVLEAVRAHEIAKFSTAVHGLFRREHETSGRVIAGQDPKTPSQISTEAVVDYTRVHGDVYGLDVRVLAMANVYGPRQRVDTHGPAIARFVAAATSGEPVELQGDGTQARDFLFIDDAVDAVVRSLDLESGSIVPIGSGVITSLSEVAEMVVEAAGNESAVVSVQGRPFDRQGIAFPTDDAATRLNWQAWTPLPEGIVLALHTT